MAAQGPSLVYDVPEWFASEYFTTYDELKTVENPLCQARKQDKQPSNGSSEETNKDCSQIAEEPNRDAEKPSQDNEKSSQEAPEAKASVSSESWLSEVSDTLRSSLISDGNKALAAFQPGILLRRISGEPQEFTNSLVRCLARDLGAHMITLDLNNLNDLSQGFFGKTPRPLKTEDLAGSGNSDNPDQGEASKSSTTEGGDNSADSTAPDYPRLSSDEEDNPMRYFFMTRCERKEQEEVKKRTEIAMNSLLHALRMKAEGAADSQPECPNKEPIKRPVVLFIDADTIYPLSRERRFFTRWRDFIRAQSKLGQSIFMVISGETSSSSSVNCECNSCTDSVRLGTIPTKLRIDARTSFTVPRQWKEDPSTEKLEEEQKDVVARETNVRKLKKALQTQAPVRLHAAFLTKPAVWDFSAHKKCQKLIESRIFTNEEIQQITRQLIGRSWNKDTLEMEDIFVVLARLSDQLAEHRTSKAGADEKNEEKKDPEEEDWDAKISSIRSDCNQYEEGLIDGVVNPKKLTGGYDSVIIDKNTKQMVAKLLQLSASRNKQKAHPLLGSTQSRGAIFYGPPGTGKTHLCRAIAKESKMNMLSIDGASVYSKWVGEDEKNVRAAFTLAAKLHPCILFIDEVDSMFAQRSTSQCRWERMVINQFLMEMDGLAGNEKAPFVIVATNRPGDLDEAFMRRLPQKVAFTLPDSQQRKEIFKIFLKDEDIADDISLDLLAFDTEGFSGSDIRSLCGAAALAWSVEQSETEVPEGAEDEAAALCLTSQHFNAAFARTHPSVSHLSLQDIESFEQRFSKTG